MTEEIKKPTIIIEVEPTGNINIGTAGQEMDVLAAIALLSLAKTKLEMGYWRDVNQAEAAASATKSRIVIPNGPLPVE